MKSDNTAYLHLARDEYDKGNIDKALDLKSQIDANGDYSLARLKYIDLRATVLSEEAAQREQKSKITMNNKINIWAGIAALVIFGLVGLYKGLKPMVEQFIVELNLEVEPASEAQVRRLELFLDDYTVTLALAVKSTINNHYHQNAYFVGATFDGKGLKNEKGIWIMLGPKDDPNITLSADLTAELASGVRQAENTKAGGSFRDAEAQLLMKALNEANF